MIWYVINLQSFVILNLLRGSEDPPLQTGMAHHPGVAWSQIPSFRRSAHWSSLSKPLICFLKPPFFVGENTCTNTDTHWLAIRSPFFSVWLPIQAWLDPSLFRWFHGFTVSRVRLRNLIRQLSSQQQQLAAVRDECFGRSCEDTRRFPMGDPQSSQ